MTLEPSIESERPVVVGRLVPDRPKSLQRAHGDEGSTWYLGFAHDQHDVEVGRLVHHPAESCERPSPCRTYARTPVWLPRTLTSRTVDNLERGETLHETSY
jgi:hypothetical protein